MGAKHYPECDSYICEGCPRWAHCDVAEPLVQPWPAAEKHADSDSSPCSGPRPYPPDLPFPQNVDQARPRLVYIAGPLSGREVSYLTNVARMLQVWRKLVEVGYACVCPAADLCLGLVAPMGFPDGVFKAQSMELLRRCDVLFVTDPDNITRGVAAELAEAERLGIPVAYDIAGLPGPQLL